MQTIW